MNLHKNKPFRSKKYLEFVRSLPCCVSGTDLDIVPHHIIACGLGGAMGSKVSDLFTIPLNSLIHSSYHRTGFDGLDQKAEVLRTIEKAVNAGVLKIE